MDAVSVYRDRISIDCWEDRDRAFDITVTRLWPILVVGIVSRELVDKLVVPSCRFEAVTGCDPRPRPRSADLDRFDPPVVSITPN
jgi:hypothetical protein